MLFKFISIKTKIIFSVLLVIFFFGFLASLVVFYITRDSLFSLKKNDLINSANVQADEIVQIFNFSMDLIKTTAKWTNIADYLAGSQDQVDHDRLLTHFEMHNVGDYYSSIYLIDKNGNALVATDPTFEGRNYSFRDYFKKSLQGEDFIDVSIGVTSGELGYYFSTPIYGTGQNFDQIIGVMVAKLKPNIVNRAFKNYTFNARDNDIYFVDQYGVVLFSSKTERVYSSLGQLNSEELAEIANKQRFADFEIKALDYGLVSQEIKNYSGSVSLDLIDKKDNKREILTLSKIGNFDFYIVFEDDVAGILASSYEVAILISFLVLSAAFSAGVFLWIAIFNFFKPLENLEDFASKISKGDYKQTIQINSRDEFQDLAKVMNEMSQKVALSQATLVDQVAQKTKDLQNKLRQVERLNKTMVGRELKMIELKKETNKFKSELKTKQSTPSN